MNDLKKKEATELIFSLLYHFGIPIIVAIISGVVSYLVDFDVSQIWIIIGIGFFTPLLVIDIIKRERNETSGGYIKRQHFIDKSIINADNIIAAILNHLAEDCYNRCSNFSKQCADCKNFNQECNGLLRNYLYETCRNLQGAIADSKIGKFELNTNIERFHTIAVEHLIGCCSKSYSVIHWLDPNAPSAKDANYDSLDYDFLSVLLQELVELKIKTKPNSAYYKKHNFEIRWLFVGNTDDMMNNYDYIFWVIDQMNLCEKVKDFFSFYAISEERYLSHHTAKFNQMRPFVKDLFKTEPSLGIFGDYFMFVDADDKSGKHGTIYTRMYKDSNTDSMCAVQEALEFYGKVLKSSNKIPIDELYTKYMGLTDEHRNKTLKGRAPESN